MSEEVIENTNPKSKYQLVLSGKGTRLSSLLTPEISAHAGCHFEIAFGSLETYYSFGNVDDSNNLIRVSLRKSGYKTFKIEKGCYSVGDINEDLQRQFKDENMENAVQFIPNYTLFAPQMSCAHQMPCF